MDVIAQNPNCTGPVKGQVLLARDILSEEFLNQGFVTEAIEEHLAANWERANGMALMRGWELRAWLQEPDDADRCGRCGVPAWENYASLAINLKEPAKAELPSFRMIPNWKRPGSPHAEKEASPYFARRARLDAAQKPGPTINMDPDVAKERIELLQRSSNPFEHAREINELRTQVLHEDAIEFRDDAPAPIVTDAPADEKPVPPPAMTENDAKKANFLLMDYREQRAVVECETDLEFLAWVRTAPPKNVIPTVKTAAKKRAEDLEK